MADGPYVFFDPLASPGNGRPYRWMIYDWTDAFGPPQPVWGNAIAAHPLTSDHFLFDPAWESIDLASNHDTTTAHMVGTKFNGHVDKMQNNRAWGGVAESSAAVYLPNSDRYYLLLSRNTWDSSAYQITYRKSEKASLGGTFASLDLGSASAFSSQNEQILLRSDRYTVAADDVNSFPPASFGSPSVFWVRHEDGFTEHPYIAFHAKFERPPRRTVFFKELHVEDTDTGQLRQLSENSAGDTTPAGKRTGVNCFRMLRCRSHQAQQNS